MTKSNNQNNSSQNNSSAGKIGDWAKTYYALRALEEDWLALGLRPDHLQALEDFIDFLKLCDHERLGFHDLRATAVIGELAKTGFAILSTDPRYVPGVERDIGRPFDFVDSMLSGGTILVLDPEDMQALERFSGLVRLASDDAFPISSDCSWSHLVGWLALESHEAIKALAEEFGEDYRPATKRIEATR